MRLSLLLERYHQVYGAPPAPMAIQRIQTDHGSEFGTDFTWHLPDLGIGHKRVPPGCPGVHATVERNHRTDEDGFCRRGRFRTRRELLRKLRGWEWEYNHRRLHLGIGGQTHAERLAELGISAPFDVRQSA